MKEAGQGRPWAQGGHPSKPGGRKEFLGKLNLQDRCGESWGAGGDANRQRRAEALGGGERGSLLWGACCHASFTFLPGPVVLILQRRALWSREARCLFQGHTAQRQSWDAHLLTLRAQEGRAAGVQIRGGQICSLLWGAGGHRSCSPGSAKGGQDLLVSAWKGQRQGEKKEVLAEFVSSCYYSE